MTNFRFIALSAVVTLSSAAMAKPPFLKVLMDTYKISPNSALGKSNCLACHATPAPPRRNVFGRDIEKAMEVSNSRRLTGEVLKKVEAKDSDGDGFSNLAELKAGTLPFDKASKPKKK